MSTERLRLRRFQPNDSRILYDWANDATVRAMSFSSAPIAWQEHKRWFELRLQDPNCVGFILLCKDLPTGMVRFDRLHDDTALLSFSIDAPRRGAGLGTRVIGLGCQAIRELWPQPPLIAHVRVENLASLAALSSAGFAVVKECNHKGQPTKLLRLQEQDAP